MKKMILFFLALTCIGSAQPFNAPHYHRTTDSAFTPWPSDSAAVWFAASFLTGKSEGDTTYIFPNRGTTAADAYQLTLSSKPVYRATAVNGQPALEFDGVNDHMQSRNLSAHEVSGPQQITIFVVQYQDGSQARNTTLGYDGTPDGTARIYLNATYDNAVYFDHVNTSAGRMSTPQPVGWDDRWNLIELYRNGTADTMRINDTVRAVAAPTSTMPLGASIRARIGAYPGGVDDVLKGRIAEIIICKRPLTYERRRAYVAYLKTKYGL